MQKYTFYSNFEHFLFLISQDKYKYPIAVKIGVIDFIYF